MTVVPLTFGLVVRDRDGRRTRMDGKIRAERAILEIFDRIAGRIHIFELSKTQVVVRSFFHQGFRLVRKVGHSELMRVHFAVFRLFLVRP